MSWIIVLWGSLVASSLSSQIWTVHNSPRNSPYSKGTTSSLGFIRRISMMWRLGGMKMRAMCKLGHILLASEVQHFPVEPNDLMTNLHCITISLRDGISTVLWTITLLHQDGPWRQCRLQTCPSMVSVLILKFHRHSWPAKKFSPSIISLTQSDTKAGVGRLSKAGVGRLNSTILKYSTTLYTRIFDFQVFNEFIIDQVTLQPMSSKQILHHLTWVQCKLHNFQDVCHWLL